MDNKNPGAAASQPGHSSASPAPADAPAGGAAGQPRVRLSAPADVLAVIPHLLGFHPASSMVVLGTAGPRQRLRFGCRYDLPDPPEPGKAAAIAEHAVRVLTREQVTSVILAGYGPGRLVTPLTDVLMPAVRRAGLLLWEALRAEDGRYWSYLCTEPGCCPPEGVPFELSSHPVTAAMTLAGTVAYPDRAALEQSLAPVSGKAAELMTAAINRAYDRAAALVAQAAHDSSETGHGGAGKGRAGKGRRRAAARQGGARRLVIAEGKRAVQEAIAAYRAGSAVTDDQLAWLAVSLTDLRVRDDAWARMDPGHSQAHLRLWTDVMRRAEPALVPAPAALLAYVAWQSGNGTLAGMAIDRALAADPGYSLALLLADVIAAGIPPSAARLPMTPEQVERSYARAAGRKRERQDSP